ncbi:hypothetical protein Tco_1004378 [Tanacetum coccineum]|uniref:Uncharacterized protein n=1 Tax=Tanacetum coccineum TaxID=301880 RepID=A0ABQ5FC16_9ASTR
MVRNVAEGEVKLLMLTEGRVILLVPPTLAASRGSSDSIDKLFDDGKDAGQEHPFEKDDDKRKTTGDARVSIFPPKKLREDYHAATPNIGRKSLATIRSLILTCSSVPSEVAEPRDDRLINSMYGLNLQTRLPSIRYVVSSDDSHHSISHSKVNTFARSPITDAPVKTVVITTTIVADVFVVSDSKDRVKYRNLENFRDSAFVSGANANVVSSLKMNEPATSSDPFYASQDLDSETLHSIYIPKWKVTNDFVLDDPYVCRDLIDRVAPPALSYNCMPWTMISYILNSMLGWRDKCALGGNAEIANLKSLLSLKEAWIDHGKARRDLSVVEAYDPSAEAKYVDAVNALRTMDFPLLSVVEDDVVLGETSLSFSLQVVHSRVQRVRGEIMEKRLSLTDVVVPLAEPLSSKSLIGEASTSAISATVGPINTLSTTFASFGVVSPLLVSDYQVLDAEPHHEDPPFITFEEEELDTTLELQTFYVRGRMFPLRSLSLYVPLPNASVTSYGPSHLGPSLPPSSAWLASLF